MKAKSESKEVLEFAPTIGQEFTARTQASDHSLKDKLYAVSMGEYKLNPAFDKTYEFWPQLFRACWDWVQAHKEGPYVEWKTEADLMSWGKARLNEKNIPVPKAWVATIYRLRALAKELSK